MTDRAGDILLRVRPSDGRTTTLRVKREWLSRWQFLEDFVVTMDVDEVEWTRTGPEPLLQWIELNRRMDRGRPNETLLPIEVMLDVIRYMNPYDSSYLEFTYINEELPAAVRKDLYESLGRFIRVRGKRLPYLMPIQEDEPAIHHNLYLYDDVLYRSIPREYYPPEVMNLLLHTDLSVVTGILHTAWLLSLSIPDQEIMSEVPWHLIRWNDVLDMAPNGYVSAYMEIERVIRDETDSEAKTAAISNILASNVTDSLSDLVHTMHLNTRLMLAGREPIQRAGEVTLDDATFFLEEGLDGSLTPMTPAPELLLQRMIEWDQKASILEPSFVLVAGYNEAPNYPSTQIQLGDLVSELVMRIAWDGASQRRTIDTIEYAEICQRVRDSLGTGCVRLIAASAVRSLERIEELHDDDRVRPRIAAKVEVLAEKALDLLDSTPEVGFQSWPIITRDAEMEEYDTDTDIIAHH